MLGTATAPLRVLGRAEPETVIRVAGIAGSDVLERRTEAARSARIDLTGIGVDLCVRLERTRSRCFTYVRFCANT